MPLNNSSKLISNIYNSRINLLKQLKYQNYNILDYENFSVNEINAMYTNDQLDMIFEKNDINDNGIKEKIYVKYALTKAISPVNIQKIIYEIFHLEAILTTNDILYLIVKEEINETMINCLKYIYDKENIFIITQNIARLQFNILEHSLVPKHRVINNEEINEVKLKYNITDNKQFPKISRFDPVSIAIGIKPDEICEITRPSKTSIKTAYYRICKNI